MLIKLSISILVLMIITVFAIFILPGKTIAPTSNNQGKIYINGTPLTIEVADEPNEHNLGLSGRLQLAPSNGMLFVFEQPEITAFWMKDMNFSLDMIWIDENLKIVGITKNISPDTFPQTFSPPSPIRYVLEVDGGWADKNKIKIGDTIKF